MYGLSSDVNNFYPARACAAGVMHSPLFFTVIIQAPENVTVGLGQGHTLQPCVVQGDVTMFIWVNGVLVDHTNTRTLEQRGISVSSQRNQNGRGSRTVTVTATERNNNTVLQCSARSNVQTNILVHSGDATISVAGMQSSVF